MFRDRLRSWVVILISVMPIINDVGDRIIKGVYQESESIGLNNSLVSGGIFYNVNDAVSMVLFVVKIVLEEGVLNEYLDWVNTCVMKNEEVRTWLIWLFDLISHYFLAWLKNEEPLREKLWDLLRRYFKLFDFIHEHLSFKFVRNADKVCCFFTIHLNLYCLYSDTPIKKLFHFRIEHSWRFILLLWAQIVPYVLLAIQKYLRKVTLLKQLVHFIYVSYSSSRFSCTQIQIWIR